MRNQWYGDHRDLVKWGTLLQLARSEQLRFILQVAYLRPDEGVPVISSERGDATVAKEVLQHFRDIRQIGHLSALADLKIEVFDRPFEAKSRQEYTAQVVARVQSSNREGWIVFLDPDTGLKDAPLSSKHVTPAEVRMIWDVLQPRDWLVLYQHASRETNWIEKRRKLFAEVCHDSSPLMFQSNKGSRDVVFFAASRAMDLC